MPQVMWREGDLFCLFELLLRRLKELLPMVVESGACVGFACPGEKQRIVVIQLFQSCSPMQIRGRTLSSNILMEQSLNGWGKVDGFFLSPTTPFVFHKGAASMTGRSVPTYRHLKYLGEARSSLSK